MDDMEAAFEDADVTTPSRGARWVDTTDASKGPNHREYPHMITDERKMELAKPDAIYMHPLPATATSRSPTACWTGRSPWYTTKLRTACTPRRRSWR